MWEMSPCYAFFVCPGRPGSEEAYHLLLQQLLAGAVEMRETGEKNNTGNEAEAVVASPLLLLNGHVCALSPLPQQETKDRADQKSKANGGSGYVLREPYAWESDEDATGFLLPRWMWEVVDGETVSYYEHTNLREGKWRIAAGSGKPQTYFTTD